MDRKKGFKSKAKPFQNMDRIDAARTIGWHLRDKRPSTLERSTRRHKNAALIESIPSAYRAY